MKAIIAILFIIIILCLAVVMVVVLIARKYGTGYDEPEETNPHIRWPERHEF